MRFDKESKVSHPASLVLETMIDRMHEIVPFLPNVDGIVQKTREDRDDGTIYIVRRWQGTPDSAPSAIRPFLTQDLLGWIDKATWHPEEWRVHWELETPVGGSLYVCSGDNYFEPHPDDPETHTRIRITGDLVVYPDRLPGVPRFLGKRLAPQVERFVVQLITPNLTDVATGLQGYLDDAAG